MRKLIQGLPVYNISPILEGEFQIALVDDPAIEECFLKFENETIKFEFNAEKQNIRGPVLIPNKPIYRNNPPRYVVFSKEAIEKSQTLFFKNGSKFNISHSDKLVELEIVESFISKDNTYPEGTWILEAHISDQELWKEIKRDQFNGFSVESVFVQFNNEYNEMDVLKQIKELVNSVAFADEAIVPDVIPEEPEVESDELKVMKEELAAFKEEVLARISALEEAAKLSSEEMSKLSIDLEKFGAQEISTPVKDTINIPIETGNKFKQYFN